MNYQHAGVADLATDEFFVEWVIAPTAESDRFWHNWLQQHPDRSETLQEARMLVQLLSQQQEEETAAEVPDTDAVWKRLQQDMAREAQQPGESGLKKIAPFFSWFNVQVQVAASLGILLVFAFFLFNNMREETVEYSTTFGEQRKVLLPDQSEIILHANSSVAFDGDWSDAEPRLVRLNGEAYFSVRHQQNDQKFVVQTADGTEVEVLGTEFDVASRPTGNRVVLASGSVRFSYSQNNSRKQLVMEPGELVEMAAGDNRPVRKRVRPEVYTSWKDGKIIFENTSLEAVADMLEHVYGYAVVFETEELAQQQITATLDDKGVENILTTISETLDVAVQKNEKSISIGLSNI